jgi:hemoglobin-like flavoprotein
MLYTWLLIVGLLGAAYAEDDCCSSEDKAEVSFMWHQVWHSSHTERKVAIMKAVFDDMLSKHPEVKDLMKAQHIEDEESPAFRAYVIRVTHGFDNLINLLDEPTILEEQIHYMADKYGAKVGLKKSYFEAVLDSFETVFPKVSTCFNVSAWNRCLRRLIHSLASKVKD